jgi:predicted alpha-1,2-mannosidase
MKKYFYLLLLPVCMLFVVSACNCNSSSGSRAKKAPVDYVNPYMGNISKLLVPTFPVIHLPNSMLRVYPEKCFHTGERSEFSALLIKGLPVIATNHRERSAFSISPVQGNEGLKPFIIYSYDQEKITPYSYEVFLDEKEIQVNFAPSHQAGIYQIEFEKDGEDNILIFNTFDGMMQVTDNGVSGYEKINLHSQNIKHDNTKVFVFFETQEKPISGGVISNGKIDTDKKQVEGRSQAVALNFGNQKKIHLRYGVSFISAEQAQKNLNREITTYDHRKIAQAGRDIWNNALGKIAVKGGSDDQKTVFYTSLYRTYERMINISEDGQYYSAFAGGKVLADEGIPFYVDDWIWDTYRAVHPLRVLIEPELLVDMIHSYIRMAEQSEEGWMPTFPEITGDTHRMNSNHAVAVVWDAYIKGLRGFDLEKAYNASRAAIMESTLIPWVRARAGVLDEFYKEHGFFPALRAGEKEFVAEVNSFERRQPVAVTLGTAYDYWCLAQIAKELKKEEDYVYFLKGSYNYRNLYHSNGFFHPRDHDGKFIDRANNYVILYNPQKDNVPDIVDFDYRFSGGPGAREFYSENNAWTYRWDVPHNVADLVELMGGPNKFAENMDKTYSEPLGKGKSAFYALLPDQTANVGQFTMANEPSLHIPYLYNYVGQPWKTQKRVRQLLDVWFRNDLMGVPGDEDGGGMSGFVVFSAIGFYPVTPGSPTYNIGSPVFEYVKMDLGNGKFFEVEAKKCSDENKYIQSATLNGKEWNKPWFHHDDIANGGKLVLVMGDKANKNWGSSLENVPPSAEPMP